MASVADQYQSLASGFRQASSTVSSSVGQVFAAITTGAKLASAPLSILSLGLKTLTSALTEPLSVIQDMAAAIHQMVSLANPVAILRFDLALKDALAVIGNMLVPVMDSLTVAARTFGDTMAGLQPVLQRLFDEIARSVLEWSELFAQVMAAAAPFIDVMTGEMASNLRTLTAGLKVFADTLEMVWVPLARLLGLTNRFNPNASSVGTAVRTASVQSVEGFANDVFKTSLKNVFGPQAKSPAEQQVGLLDGIDKNINLIKIAIEGIWGVAKAWAKGIGKGGDVASSYTEGATLGLTGEMAKYLLGKMFIR